VALLPSVKFYDYHRKCLTRNRISFIRHIKRPLREKIILAALMAAGLLAMGIGIVKTILLGEITTVVDFFYKLSILAIWMYVSISTGKLFFLI
jgi:hypothetical protein